MLLGRMLVAGSLFWLIMWAGSSVMRQEITSGYKVFEKNNCHRMIWGSSAENRKSKCEERFKHFLTDEEGFYKYMKLTHEEYEWEINDRLKSVYDEQR